MRVFVTGATGWIGSAVVPELLAAGHEVVGLARSDTSAEALTAAGARAHRGSLDDVDALRAAAADADGVIHLAFDHAAAFAGDFATAAARDRTAIAALAEGLTGTGRPLVIASGLAGHPSGRVVTEEDAPDLTTHAGERMRAERAVLDLAASGVRSVSVRLSPSVHGAGDTGFAALLVQIARERGVVGDGANTWPAVHRSDAAKLFRLALEDAPAGTVLHGAAEEGVPLRAVAEAIGAQLDLPAVSVASADAAEHFGWFATFVQIDVRASSARTRALLGWEPTGPTLLEDLEAGRYTQVPVG